MEITINEIYIALLTSLIPAFLAFKLGKELNK